jgi:alkylhydroperoxidase/carboxymuconolactone decarboxylase family protein YurZ
VTDPDERAADRAEQSGGSEVLKEILRSRGYVLPAHELMDAVDPEILRRYRDLSAHLLFGPEPRALDLKTRYLVLVGITTAVRGDPEGVEWSAQRAMDNGATEREVLEAMVLTMLPAGVPALEGASKVWTALKDGEKADH